MDNGFYLKLTEEQANALIVQGINEMFGGTPTKFDKYTYYIEDTETGDKYWRVENLQYDGIKYDIIGWLDINQPDLTRYDHEFVKQFLPVSEGI